MSDNGKGGNNNKKRQRFLGRKDEAQKQERKKPVNNMLTDGKFEKSRQSIYERPHWTEPKLPTDPIPIPTCPWCSKPIKDITTALTDKNTGLPVHFDCVLAKINEMENLEKNDTICYIGGGRFGVIHYNNPPDIKDFTIKRTFEWENKDNHFEWCQSINKYFSVT
jgi:hypothetical protein